MFIVDYVGRRVRKVRKADGVIQTIAGNGQRRIPARPTPSCSDVDDASTTPLTQPQHVAAAANGEVYFSDPEVNLIRRLTPHGSVYRMRRVAPTFALRRTRRHRARPDADGALRDRGASGCCAST